ncbi:MAG: histidinol-phosphatase [Clostridia bacterium]|nr:histidinol-phosphatase [Clostridia bacterium]
MQKLTEYKQNLHTHTRYCDGNNTAEEMILRAIELGFDTLGFSGHSYLGFEMSWTMSAEGTEKYKAEIRELKKKYASRINVLCGLEYDMYSQTPIEGYDYLIGSCHGFYMNGTRVECDSNIESVKQDIKEFFGGDGMKYAKEYYRNMAKLYDYGDFDVVGHFDLLTKYCEQEELFDVNSLEYKNAALEALHALSSGRGVFEINTGAISRGYRTTPYPAPFLLKEMKTLGCRVILTSDCHDKNFLDCEYKNSLEFIRACGFDSVCVWENGGFCEVGI